MALAFAWGWQYKRFCKDYPKISRLILSGIIYYWQAYELTKAKELKVSECVSQITAFRACFAAKK